MYYKTIYDFNNTYAKIVRTKNSIYNIHIWFSRSKLVRQSQYKDRIDIQY